MVNHTVDHANHTLKGVVDSEITIFNVFGEEVVNLTPALSIHGEGVKLDVSSLSPGVYFVKVGDKTIKFVKY